LIHDLRRRAGQRDIGRIGHDVGAVELQRAAHVVSAARQVVPVKLVRLPLTSKVSPAASESKPLLVKLPAVVKLRPVPSEKLAPASLTAKLASALAPCCYRSWNWRRSA
jgi:hypothetical protein